MTFEVWSDAPRRKIIRDIGKFYEFLAERYPRRVRAANAFSYTKKKIPGGAEVNVSFGIARRTVRKKR